MPNPDSSVCVYYAHCQSLYDTPQEQRDIQLLESLRWRVINPNHELHNLRCTDLRATAGSEASELIMQYFRRVIDTVEWVCFRALPDGRIPAGVAYEIAYARSQNMPVLELPHNPNGRMMTIDATRDYLREVGQR